MDIEREFLESRPWHKEVTCSYADGSLTLVAVNEYDPEGKALSDEFSDCLSAYLGLDEFDDDGWFGVVKVEVI